MGVSGTLPEEPQIELYHVPRPAPQRDDGDIWVAAGIFAITCLFLWPLRDFVWFNADEGFSLVGAERILHGQVPYRDFSAFYTLGSFYLTAAVFKLFGDVLVVARTVVLAYAGIFASVTYLLSRRLCGRSGSAVAAALVVTCMPLRFLMLHNWDSTLLALLALCCAHRLLDSSSYVWSIWVGFFTALTLLTEESKGAGLILGLGVAAIGLAIVGRKEFLRLPNIAMAAVGFAVPLLVTIAYFASKHVVGEMVETCLWPLRHYSIVNEVHYGFIGMSPDDIHALYSSQDWSSRLLVLFFTLPMFVIPVLPVLVLLNTGWSIILLRKRGTDRQLERIVLGGCAFFGIFLATLKTGRADLHHLLYLIPLFMYLVPALLDAKRPGMQQLYRAKPVIAFLLLISFAGFGSVPLLKARTTKLITESRRGKIRVGDDDVIMRYIEEHVAEGRPIYVHPYQPFYYYITRTVNPIRYDFLQPGMASADQYQSAIHDLETDRTPVVLLDMDFAYKVVSIWPSTPLSALAKDPVADYIVQHYRGCRLLNMNEQRAWTFLYMVRDDLPCPTAEDRH